MLYQDKPAVDLLPSEKSKPRVLRAEFSSKFTEADRVIAEVDLDGKTRTLSAKIKTE